MSRHTDVPIFARRRAPMHPAVHAKIMRELEQDVAPPAHMEIMGYFENGDYISYRSRVENEPYRVNFLDVISLLSLALIILLLGVAVGLWIVQGTLQ